MTKIPRGFSWALVVSYGVSGWGFWLLSYIPKVYYSSGIFEASYVLLISVVSMFVSYRCVLWHFILLRKRGRQKRWKKIRPPWLCHGDIVSMKHRQSGMCYRLDLGHLSYQDCQEAWRHGTVKGDYIFAVQHKVKGRIEFKWVMPAKMVEKICEKDGLQWITP